MKKRELHIPGINPNVIATSMPAFHSMQQAYTTLVVLPTELFLEQGLRYAWRVTVADPQHVGAYSAWRTLSIPELQKDTALCPDCRCAESPTPPPITNFTLRKDLQPGDIISNASGATRFILKTVVPQSDGVYKGLLWFWMEIWNVKFLCEYWDLSVNTDNVMIGGDYESVSNPQFLLDADAAKNFMDSLANAINDLTVNTTVNDTLTLDIPIESMYIDADGNVVVVSTNPDETVIEETAQDDSTGLPPVPDIEQSADSSNYETGIYLENPGGSTDSGQNDANITTEDTFEIQLYNGTVRVQKDTFLLITVEPAMPDVRVKPFRADYTGVDTVEMRLEIMYQRDGVANNGSAINNLRNDVTAYPSSNDWQSVKINEEWDIDFGNDIRGGTAHLICRKNNKIDTVRFYIRGKNPTEAQIKNYLNQQGYYSQYWFIVKMTRQESSMRQFGTGTSYHTAKQSGTVTASGEPLYGRPRGFGLKQLDNWGNGQHATPQHLWNWKANIDGGVEVIREKEQQVNIARDEHTAIINRWNDRYSDSPVSDSLTIIEGENANSTILTITEGNEVFAVSPSGNQRDIYDARWIKLFNGGSPYYQVNRIDANSKPRREINRTNNANKNYVQDVCNKAN